MGKSIRSFLNENSALVTIAAVVLLVLSLAFIVINSKSGGRSSGPIDVWYYDLNTGDLFEGTSDQIPPIEAPSGPLSGQAGVPAGVKAHVFACNDCGDVEDRFIGYLEMYRPEVRDRLLEFRNNPKAMETMSPEMMPDMMMESGMLVSNVEDQNWVEAMSEMGMNLTTQAIRSHPCPDGKPPHWCAPGRK